MVFQEPKVELVTIDLSINALDEQSKAGVEACTGDIAPSNNCGGSFWL